MIIIDNYNLYENGNLEFIHSEEEVLIFGLRDVLMFFKAFKHQSLKILASYYGNVWGPLLNFEGRFTICKDGIIYYSLGNHTYFLSEDLLERIAVECYLLQ